MRRGGLSEECARATRQARAERRMRAEKLTVSVCVCMCVCVCVCVCVQGAASGRAPWQPTAATPTAIAAHSRCNRYDLRMAQRRGQKKNNLRMAQRRRWLSANAAWYLDVMWRKRAESERQVTASGMKSCRV